MKISKGLFYLLGAVVAIMIGALLSLAGTGGEAQATPPSDTYYKVNYQAELDLYPRYFEGGIGHTGTTAESLTSPTVTFAVVSNEYRAVLNSDANQTGIYPTGGYLGQLIVIESGAGSNTMRFDDGTSMTLGGNITLTEGQGDILALRCMSADGDEWRREWSADN